MATVDKRCASIVAHHGGVRVAVYDAAEDIAVVARALFAQHDHPGGHSIETEHAEVDSFVVLEGPAPLSVEFGRSPNADGKEGMRGLHILGRAARL